MLQVPAAAIIDMGEGPALTVVRDGKTVVLHPEIGKASKGWVAITKTDLKEGEPVIVEGGYNVPEGTAATSGKNEEEHEGKDEAKGKDEAGDKGKVEAGDKSAAPSEHKNAAAPEHEG